MDQSSEFAFHTAMKSLNSVALRVVNRSGSSLDIKGCHGHLKNMRYKGRSIIGVNYGRDSSVRKVIPNQ